MHSTKQYQMLITTMDSDSMIFHVPQKAVKGKYDVTWTQKRPKPQATSENMPSNAGDQKWLMWQTKARMPRRLVMPSRSLAQEVVLSLTVLKDRERER